MKKQIIAGLSGLLLLILTGCPSPSGGGGGGGELPEGKFWVMETNDNLNDMTYVARSFSEAVSVNITSTHAEVWIADNLTDTVTDADVKHILDTIDNNYDAMVTAFGTPSDVNGDGKIAIMIYQGEYNAGGSYAGYYDPNSLLSSSIWAYSNEMDLIFVNGNIDVHEAGSTAFDNTVIHEFQHLINNYETVWTDGGNAHYMSTWMNEGMSENAASMMLGEESGYPRLIDYMNNTDLANGQYSVKIWEQVIENYSLSYMFFAYLRGRFGDDIFEQIHETSTSNNIYDLNTVISQQTAYSSESPVNDNYFDLFFEDFVEALQAEDMNDSDEPGTGFPIGFFDLPTGWDSSYIFSVPMADSGTHYLRSYAFLYSTGLADSDNSDDLKYLDDIDSISIDAAVHLDSNKASWSARNGTESSIAANVVNGTTASARSAGLPSMGHIDVLIEPVF